MLLVLDSNEYIFSLGSAKDRSCEKLLEVIAAGRRSYSIRIPRLIVTEVHNNLSPEAFKDFMLFIMTLASIDEDSSVPFELGSRYESKGLKPADAFIAAYAEWTGAEILVTENRHFLSRQTFLPFKVLSADRFLKLIRSS